MGTSPCWLPALLSQPQPWMDVCVLSVLKCSGIEAAWAGGTDGRVVIDRFLDVFPVRLVAVRM